MLGTFLTQKVNHLWSVLGNFTANRTFAIYNPHWVSLKSAKAGVTQLVFVLRKIFPQLFVIFTATLWTTD